MQPQVGEYEGRGRPRTLIQLASIEASDYPHGCKPLVQGFGLAAHCPVRVQGSRVGEFGGPARTTSYPPNEAIGLELTPG